MTQLSSVLTPKEQNLHQHLESILGTIPDELFEGIKDHVEWINILGGSMLMRQGDVGDSMYLVISGRLRALHRNVSGETRILGDISRGEVIGEMTLYTREPRTASIVALRDSVLVRLSKSGFDHLLELSPQASVSITKQIIARLRKSHDTLSSESKPITFAVVPLSKELDIEEFSRQFTAQLQNFGSIAFVDQNTFSDQDSGAVNRQLDELEALHDGIVMLCNLDNDDWTQRCLRHADEVMWVAQADDTCELREIERRFTEDRQPMCALSEVLVLLHDQQVKSPTNTKHWLEPRKLADHIHVRMSSSRDMARLARIQTRNAVGLVFAGGGAKGFAHLGALKAFEEHGVDIDFAGGTSIGAVMACYAASDLPADEVIANARRAFQENPTSDYSFMPMISLISGKKLRKIIHGAITDLIEDGADVTDLWKNFFCISSNYSKAKEELIQDGCLVDALISSVAIPGALPPVIRNGEILCDGGTFNNFPADVMRKRRGVKRVIGVDLRTDTKSKVGFEKLPSNWELFKDKFRKKANKKYPMPSLISYLLNVTLLYSTSRHEQSRNMVDLYINPDTRGVGMLDWTRFEEVVQIGYEQANKALALEKAKH